MWLSQRDPGFDNRPVAEQPAADFSGFEQRGLKPIALGAYNFSPQAIRAYEKAGFATEGTEREALLHEGKWIDAPP
jgi:RimJ/RimL family protein N-acetyltransferase